MPSYGICPYHGPYDLYAHEDGCPQCIEEWEAGKYEREACSDPDERDWLNPARHPEVDWRRDWPNYPLVSEPQCIGVMGQCIIHERPISECD